MELTQEDLQKMVKDAAEAGATAAIRAANTVDPNARPGGGESAKPAAAV